MPPAELLDTIDAKLRNYADRPGMGTVREDFGVGLKSFHVKSYVIFYRRVKGGIQLVRVLHGARRIDRSFFE
jgi:toxin ParE1/3/4